MYYGSGTGGRWCICAGQTLCDCVHSIGAYLYLQNNPAKFHPDPIWNDGPLGFFEDGRPNKKKNNNKMNCDMWSVPDPKSYKNTQAYT